MAAKKSEPAPAGDDVRYDVTLNGRFELHQFWYLPGNHHVVDQVTLDAMNAAGVVADVKQLP
jgi:hypothetical protein